MKTNAKEHSEAIFSSILQRGESSMVYNSYSMASLSYGTAATSLNVKECEDIQRPVVNAILPKIGVNRNTARKLVFRTSTYDVIGMDNLATVHGFAQLHYLIGSLRTQDTMGALYQMLLEYTKLECGKATPIIESDITRYEPTILTKNWITEYWMYLSLCKHRPQQDRAHH
jgi:hypothetical protein